MEAIMQEKLASVLLEWDLQGKIWRIPLMNMRRWKT